MWPPLPLYHAVFVHPRQFPRAGDDCNVVLWDLASGRKITTFAGHRDVVNSVAFSSDGSLIASGSQDNTVRLWNARADATAADLGAPLFIGGLGQRPPSLTAHGAAHA